MKGLLEECKEFIRPKNIVEKLAKNKRDIANRDVESIQRKRTAKKHDIAI